MPDPNPQILKLMTTRHFKQLRAAWPESEADDIILKTVLGWREIACRRAINKYGKEIESLSEHEWEAFDLDTIQRGLRSSLIIMDEVIEEMRRKGRPRRQSENDIFPDDDDCEGEEWRIR